MSKERNNAPATAAVRIPPPAIYIGGFLAGLGIHAVAPLPALTPGPAVTLGVAAAILGAVLAGSGIAALLRAGTNVDLASPTTALVTCGPFRVTRNPIYLGLALLYVGGAVGFAVTWALAVLPLVVIVVDRAVIAREERYLERLYGDEYRRYRSRVRRWIPVTAFSPADQSNRSKKRTQR